MRSIHSTWTEEGDGSGKAELSEDGEVVFGCKKDTATLASSGRLVEIEDDTLTDRVVREKFLASTIDSQEVVEAVDLCWVGQELGSESLVGSSSRSGGSCCGRGLGRRESTSRRLGGNHAGGGCSSATNSGPASGRGVAAGWSIWQSLNSACNKRSDEDFSDHWRHYGWSIWP